MSERELEPEIDGPADPAPRFGPIPSALISVLLFSTLFAFAELILFALFIAPLATIPLLIAGRRPGFEQALATAALATAAIAMVYPAMLLAYPLLILLPVLSVRVWEVQGGSEGRWVSLCLGLGTIIWLIAVVVWALPESAPDALRQAIDGAFNTWMTDLDELGIDTIANRRMYSQAWPLLPFVVPAMVPLYLMTVLFWIRARLPFLGCSVPVTAFEDYRSWEWLPAGFVAAGALAAFGTSTLQWIGTVVLISVLGLFFVGGLAMIRAHVARWLGRGVLVRWLVVALCVMTAPILVAAIGLADNFFVFPRPQTGEAEE